MFSLVDRRRLRFFQTFLYLSLTFSVCSLFFHILNWKFDIVAGDLDFDLRIDPWNEDSLSLATFVLRGIDFRKASSLLVRFHDDVSGAVFIIPDYDARDFRCARLSTMDAFDSGYMRFVDGEPRFVEPIRSLSRDPDAFRIPIPSSSLPRPRETFRFVLFPPPSIYETLDLGKTVAEIRIEYLDGTDQVLTRSRGQSFIMNAVFGFALTPLILLFDRRVLLRKGRRALPTPFTRRRIVKIRLLSLPVFVFLVNSPLIIQKMNIVALLLIAWLLLGAYPLPRLTVRRGFHTENGILFAISFLAVAIFFVLAIQIIRHTETSGKLSSFREGVFHGRKIERKTADQKVVLCLGGSSTQGFPFAEDWPYDYPAQLETILSEDIPNVVVANGGVDGATTRFAQERLLFLMDDLKPDLVILNYMFNDFIFIGQRFWIDRQKRLIQYEEMLQAVVRAMRKKGAACVFVLEPTYASVYLDGAQHYEPLRRAIENVARKEDVLVIDPLPAFCRERQRFLFMDGGPHMTRFGTALLARIVAQEVGNILIQGRRKDPS